MLLKILGLGASGLLSLTLLGMAPTAPQRPTSRRLRRRKR